MSTLATKNVAAVLAAVALALGVSFTFASPAKADAISDLQAQVQALLAQIASIQGGSTTTTSTSCFTFTRNHQMGDKGGEVMEIQKFLNTHGAVVAASGAGSAGMETSTFGGLTKAAVAKFQAANGVSPAAGYWGPITRAKANSMCTTTGGTTGGTGTTPTGVGLTVAAAVQPANSLVPQNSSRVPFTTFTLTNNSGAAVTVTGVSVMRTGPALDAVFTGGGVILLDEAGMQLGVQRTFNSDHTVVAGDPFTMNPGQTKTLTVAGNFTTGPNTYSGQVVSVTVTGINTSAPVAGVLPITGASHTLNGTLTIGSVTTNISSFDPNGAQSKNIGDTGVKVTGVRFTAGSVEDLKLYSVRFRLNGSVSSGDLTNVKGVVDGTMYPATVSTDGRYYTVSIPGGLLVQKGFSKDIYLQGDITGSNASGRIVEFDIDRTTDVYIVGQTYGYGIAPAAGVSALLSGTTHATAITSSQPWFQGSTVSISGASVTTINKANEVAAQNIAVTVPNQVLGGFATDIKGEGLTVQQMVFTVASSSTTGGPALTNVSIVDANGAVVAGPVDQVGSTLTFTNSVTFPVARAVYTLKGKVHASTANNSTMSINTTPSSGWTGVTGQTTGNTVSLSGSGVFSMNTMTIRTATLSTSVSATPAAQTVVAGSQDLLFANIQLDASQSGEDIRVSNLPTTITVGGGAALTDLTSCRVYDGATALTTGSNVTNPTASPFNFTFDNSITVTKGTVKTLSIKCNVSSGATGTFQVGLGTIANFNATGVTSSNTVTATGSAGGGQVMTIGAASLAVSLDSSSPSAVIAAGGTTGVTLGAYKFRATNDNIQLQSIGLVRTSGSAADLANGTVTLWQGSTQIGTAVFAAGATYATSSLSTQITLTKDTDVVIVAKGDLAGVGTALPGTSGNVIKIDVNANTNTYGVSVGAGSTVNASGSTAVAGVTLYKSFPTIAQDALTSAGSADGKLIRFKVTANSAGSIGVAQVAWSVTYANATVANAKLYAFSDAAYSTPVSGQASDGQVGSTTPVVTSGNTYKPIVAANAVQVSAGQTVYFELRGDVVPASSASVVTKILGDTTAVSPAAATALTANSFVWSPNTNGTSATTTADYVNGANVIGLPSAGFTQARGL